MRCQKNYRQWLGTEGLHRALKNENDLVKYESAFYEAKYLLFEIQLDNGVLVWPTRWEDTNVFPDRCIPGGIMASTLLAICCAGVNSVGQSDQLQYKVTKRFSVLKVGGEVIADETLDFPIGAIAYHHCTEKGIALDEPFRLTIADTVPALEPHCRPKLNHIDPFPVFPISSSQRVEQTEEDEALGQETEFTWEEVEARTNSSDEEVPTSPQKRKTKRKGRKPPHPRKRCRHGGLAEKEWRGRRYKDVEAKWEARGYSMRCAITTSGHSRPAAY